MDEIDVTKLIASLGYVNAWSPQLISTVADRWNVVPGGWRIGVNLTFYVVFPLFAALVTSMVRGLVFHGLCLITNFATKQIAASILTQVYGPVPAANFLYSWFPNQMTVSGVPYLAWRRLTGVEGTSFAKHLARHGNALATPVLALFFASAYLHLPCWTGLAPPYVPQFKVLSLCHSAFILALSRARSSVFINPSATAAGKISFSAYLPHLAFIWLTVARHPLHLCRLGHCKRYCGFGSILGSSAIERCRLMQPPRAGTNWPKTRSLFSRWRAKSWSWSPPRRYKQHQRTVRSTMLRCPLCAGLNHTILRGELLSCKLCSLGFRNDNAKIPPLDVYRIRDGFFQFSNWNSWLGKMMRRPMVDNRQSFFFAPPTVKMFATQQGRHATTVRSSLPIVPIFAPWSYGCAVQAKIETQPEQDKRGLDPRLTLGIIAARDAWHEALDLCIDMAGCAADTIVVLDTADVTLAAKLECDLRGAMGNRTRGLLHRVLAHPLGANFAIQRNFIQQQARTEWVLQLDCDERLTAVTKTALSGVIDDAEREGWDAVAFSRRNLVDGIVSALYPDVQYRLLRRAVVFTGAVHEYPQLGPSQHAFFYLGAEIIHKLASERLEQRGAWYEKIQGGAGRPHDTALLRLPLESAVSVAR